MTQRQLVSFLARQSLFAGLSPVELQKVAARLELRTYADGEEVFAQGAPCDGWYLVVSGAVRIVNATPGGADHDLATLEEGDGFGEMGLIDDEPRLASALADGPAQLAFLPRASFRALLAAEGPLGAYIVLAMAKVLCRRQRELTAILTDLVDEPDTAQASPREMISMLLLSGRQAD